MSHLCKKCRDPIEVGEACRSEPIQPGSSHHYFYHCGCYFEVKEERQREDMERTVKQARTVC